MVQDPLPLLITLGFIFLSLVLFVLVFMSFYSLLNRWLRYLQAQREKNEEEIINHAYDKAANIIESAKKESLDVLEKANRRAQKTLLKAKVFTEETRNDWEASLADVSNNYNRSFEDSTQKLLDFYKQLIAQQEDQSLKVFNKASSALENQAIKEIQSFEEKLEDETQGFEERLYAETVNAQKQIDEKLNQKFEQMEKELEEYKAHRIQQIDESITPLIGHVAKEVLGSTINYDQHKQLILESLHTAKEQQRAHEQS